VFVVAAGTRPKQHADNIVSICLQLSLVVVSANNPYLRNGHLAVPYCTVRSLSVLNRFDPHSSSAGEAEVKYLDGDFRVLRPGAFVRCAVTGTPIPLEELKYWSVERQEAYANPRAVLERLYPARAD